MNVEQFKIKLFEDLKEKYILKIKPIKIDTTIDFETGIIKTIQTIPVMVNEYSLTVDCGKIDAITQKAIYKDLCEMVEDDKVVEVIRPKAPRLIT